MTPNQAAAFIQSQTALFNAELEQFKAANADAILHKRKPRYDEPYFAALISRYEPTIGYNAVNTLFYLSAE